MLTEVAQKQAYDNVLKRWFEKHVKEILPFLLEERELARDEDKNATRQKTYLVDGGQGETEEMNIEVLIPPRRNDRVYRTPYQGKMHIADVEIETSPNGFMAIRSLIYHSLLMEKYREPIISLILYPFKRSIARSPLEDTNGDGKSIAFCFRTLPLWRFNARKYFERQLFCMFALLPAMGGATQDMLFEALDLMVHWYQDKQDEIGLREEFITFGILLRRAAILPPADIEEVSQKMINYDPFIMEDPHFGALIRAAASAEAKILAQDAEIQAEAKAEAKVKILAEAKAEVLAEAKAEVLAEAKAEVLAEAKAEVLSLTAIKNTLLRIVEARFPELGISSTHEAILPDTREALEVLIVKVATAPSVSAARLLLALPVLK